ncbi:MAG: ATP-binding protein [Pseudomonadota bacterium]
MDEPAPFAHPMRAPADSAPLEAAPPAVAPSRLVDWEYSLARDRFTRINPHVEALLGYPAADWLAAGFWPAHLHPDDRHRAPDFRAQAVRYNGDREFEYRMIAADGRTVWLREYVGCVADSGDAPCLRGLLLDITEQKQAQGVMEMLARTSGTDDTDAFFQACVRNLARAYDARYAFIGLLQPCRQSVQTVAVCAGGTIVPNFAYSLDGTPCKDILDLKKELVPRDAVRLYPDDAKLAQMAIDSYFGTPLIASNGEMIGLISVMDTRPMELTHWTAPILGVFASRVAVELERKAAHDNLMELNATLEQRVRQRTRELEAANQELEAFAYSVSHDLRAPLRAIDGFSQALLEDYGNQLDAGGHGHLQRVRNGTRHMGILIDDLLRLSRIARAPLEPTEVDLGSLAQDIVESLRQSLPDRQVHIEISPALRAYGDPGLLRILLDNLLGNAWKYSATRPAAHIVFDAVRQAGDIVFRIRDNGVGFDMKHADKLFGAFQRLHRQDPFEGSGIGLATARRIVHRHGGRIWAEAAPDQGASFHFTLGETAFAQPPEEPS